MKALGVKDRICHRSHKHQAALPYWQTQRNKLIAKRRAMGPKLRSAAVAADNEAILIWAIPDFTAWADFEAGGTDDQVLLDWKESIGSFGAFVERTLMVNAPLAPLRTGRQPQIEDRRPLADI